MNNIISVLELYFMYLCIHYNFHDIDEIQLFYL